MTPPPGGWLLCSACTKYQAHDLTFVQRAENGQCQHRAKWLVDGAWYCSIHDPHRPRCRNARAHPLKDVTRRHLEAVGYVVEGTPIDPQTPRAIGRFAMLGTSDQMPLCSECARGRDPAIGFMPPSSVRTPCVLCQGKTVIYDDDDRPLACPCTPVGRELANGVPDAVVLARLAGPESADGEA